MLIQALRGGFDKNTFVQLLLMIPIILISLTVHEYSHGYAAYRCGDMTARNFGRLSLNPIKHLDPIGTIMMLIFGFGYAKPVPVNARNFNKPRRDMCIVAFAGPLSNLIMGFLGLAVSRFVNFIIIKTSADAFLSSQLYSVWSMFCVLFIYCNIGLAVFNLIPVPPLDGSRLLFVVLPAKISYYLSKYEQFIMVAVLLLLYFGLLDSLIYSLRNLVITGFNSFLSLFPIFY